MEALSSVESAPVDSDDAFATSVVQSACRRLVKRGFDPEELHSLIEAVFSGTDENEAIGCLCGDDVQTFIDVIDEALDNLDFSPPTRKKCLEVLYETCSYSARLPKSLRIPLCYDRTGNALHRGGFGDIWKGEHRGRDVAVKALRIYSDSDLQGLTVRFCKEVVKWKSLRHPNVLPLIGATMAETQFAMTSEWVVNGNINDFVKAHPEVDQFGLLRGVARGLIYIHDQEMIHGNLKGANILIDQTGNARLADFGLLAIVSDPTNLLSPSSYMHSGAARWMSPELIDPQRFGFEKSRLTKVSDCYALGMVVYETISGHLPFHQHSGFTVILKVLSGERPPREVGFTEGVWELLELCWASQPNDRPTVEDFLQLLEMELPSPGPDVEVEEEDGCCWADDPPPSTERDSNLCDPQTMVDPVEEITPAAPPPSKSRSVTTTKPRKCSSCGQVGHTERWQFCPKYALNRVGQPTKKIGDTSSILFHVEPTPGDSGSSHQTVHYSRMRLQQKPDPARFPVN